MSIFVGKGSDQEVRKGGLRSFAVSERMTAIGALTDRRPLYLQHPLLRPAQTRKTAHLKFAKSYPKATPSIVIRLRYLLCP
jgi:hypothetical protein